MLNYTQNGPAQNFKGGGSNNYFFVILEEMYYFTSKVGTDVDLFQKYNGKLCKINFNNAW